MKMPHRSVLPFLVFVTMLSAHVRASRGEDSLHAALHGNSGTVERANALLELADRFRSTRPQESLAHARSAFEFAGQARDKELQHRAYGSQCASLFQLAAYDDLLAAAIKASALGRDLGDAKAMAQDLRWMSIAYEQLGDHGSALEMSKRALVFLKTTNDDAAIGEGIIDVMNALVGAGRFNEVIRFGEEALAHFDRANDSVGHCRVQIVNGEALITQGRFADALPLLHRSAEVLAASDQKDDAPHVQTLLAEAFLGLGRFADAARHLDNARALRKGTGTTGRTPHDLQLRSRLAQGQGDPEAALALLRESTVLKDSLVNEQARERMAGLAVQYELASSEAQIEELRKVNQLNESLIDSAKARGIWWLALIGLLLVASVFLALGWLRNRRAAVRSRMRTQLIQAQAQEIQKQNLELQRQNLRLAETLISEEEKDVLLREIHHRVKNNLQIISALLRAQAFHMGDPRLEQALIESQGRIASMASVHELLYKASNVGKVRLADQVKAIAEGVFSTFGSTGRVQLELRAMSADMPIDTLTPLGLILNELITNSVKHAFAAEEQGIVRVAIDQCDDRFELRYSDSGSRPSAERFLGNGSFGLELVRLLAQQLDGRLQRYQGERDELVLTFHVAQQRVLRKAS